MRCGPKPDPRRTAPTRVPLKRNEQRSIEASAEDAPFEQILVWKFSSFTRKREHAVAFKSMLRRRGVRVGST